MGLRRSLAAQQALMQGLKSFIKKQPQLSIQQRPFISVLLAVLCVHVYKCIVERARPVRSFCLCVKVRMQGTGLFCFFFSVSTKGGRCLAALFYCTLGLLLPLVRLSVLDPHSATLALEVQHDLHEVLNPDS